MKEALNRDILIVDDEPNAIKVLSAILSMEGYNVFEALDVESATMIVRKKNVDAVITDLKMPGKDGIQFFDYLRREYPDIPVIFLTAYGSVESAVSAMTAGAVYYFIKPPDYQKLKSILSEAVKGRFKQRAAGFFERTTNGENTPSFIFGNTGRMRQVVETIDSVKDSSSSVLICGETGTGKELVARALHQGSRRRDKPLVIVNCAAIPKELIESELFGYEKGAFTNAYSTRIGRFEEASGGTIFLDEIGELELPLQSKLLRVIQEREIERLGSSKKIKVEFRLVSSTNRDLRWEAEHKRFREDLFYRINVIEICLPPLREKKEDIPLLVKTFVKEFCVKTKKVLSVTDEVWRAFQEYDWPGNIRQLKNTIERAVVLAKGKQITLKELPEELYNFSKETETDRSSKTLKEIEWRVIEDTLKKCQGNKSEVSRLLGISRKALYKKLKDSNFFLEVSNGSRLRD